MSSARAALTISALGVALGACAGEGAGSPGDGAACDAVTPCAGDRLCVDGRCELRAVPTPPEIEPLGPPAWLDIVSASDVVTSDADMTEPDVIDGVDRVDDDGSASEATSETRVLLGVHDALTDPSDTRMGLAAGQGAAREVVVVEPGEAVAIEVVMRAPVGAASACGWYELALWLPDARGIIVPEPAWRSAPRLVAAAADAVDLALPERVPLPAGPVRFGLIYQGPCEASFAPWIGLDASGDASDSWVWAGVWIPGAALDLEGRWGLSLVIAL